MLLVDHLDFQQLQAKQLVLHTLTTAPAAPVEGQLYANTANNTTHTHNGTAWVPLTQGPTSAISGNLATFSGTTGGVLQDGGVALSSLATLPLALTDLASWADGSVIIGGVSDWTTLVAGTSGYVLTMGASRPEWSSPGAPSAHALLGTAHSDTATDAVTRGSIIIGNVTPLWDELVIGATGTYLYSDGLDVSWKDVDFSDLGTTPTTLSGYGISDSMANFDTALSDGSFMFTGDAPSSHTLLSHTIAGETAGHVLAADSATTYSIRQLLGSEISNTESWTSNTGTVTSVTGGTGVSSTGGTTPSIALTVDELAEKTGDLVGSDRLVGTSGTTNFAETISNIPLSIFDDDITSSIDLTTNTAADSGTGSISTSQTFTFSGSANEIETSASGQTITIGLPNDVTIGNDLTVTGDLTVNGTTTTVNTATLTVEDPLIFIAHDNATDVVDTGLYWAYDNTPTLYGGIFRDATDGIIKFFEDNQALPTTTVNVAGTGYALADVAFGTVTAGTWQGTTISSTSLGSHSHAGTDINSGLVGLTYGGTGINASGATNGQLLIGGTTSNDLQLATLSEGTGIDITNGVNTISIAVDVTPASEGAERITRMISASAGDGDASWTWNHAQGLSYDTDIIVQVWGVAANTDIQVFPTITVVDGNNIKFDFGFNVTAGDYKAVLIY